MFALLFILVSLALSLSLCLLPCCFALAICFLDSHSAAVRSFSLGLSLLPFCFVPVSFTLPLSVPSPWLSVLCRFVLSPLPASCSPAATKFFQRHLFSFLFFRGLRNSSLSFVKQSSSFSSKTINKIGKNLCCSAESV